MSFQRIPGVGELENLLKIWQKTNPKNRQLLYQRIPF